MSEQTSLLSTTKNVTNGRSNISNARRVFHQISKHRSGLKKRGTAEFFQPTLKLKSINSSYIISKQKFSEFYDNKLLGSGIQPSFTVIISFGSEPRSLSDCLIRLFCSWRFDHNLCGHMN